MNLNNEKILLNIGKDITELKKEELVKQELLENEKQLTEELTVSNEELQSTTEELQITNEALMHQGDELLTINKTLEDSHEKLKKSLEELRNTETLLSSITNLSSDVIYIKDSQSRWIFANPALERIASKKSDELLGKNDLEIYSNHEIGNAILKNDRRIMDSGKEETLEEIIETPKGLRSFISVKTPRFNEKGQVVGIVGISHDITDRKKIEESLKESELKYHSLFDNLPLTTNLMRYVLNDEGEVVDWVFEDMNSKTQELLGQSKKELKGKSLMELMGQNHIASFLPVVNEIRRTGKVATQESHLEAMDMFHITTFAPLSNELFLTIDQDITKRKKAEEALQRNEAEISFLLELNDALRQIDDPIQIQETASRLLGEHLQADRVFYSEIVVKDDIEILVIENDYHRPGVSSLTGQFVFKEFSKTDYDDYRAGRTVSSPNVFTDERESIQREAYRTADVSAFIGVPLIKSGELVSTLGVLQRQPRNWTLEEIKLVEQVVERTWHAVQRTRAEKALQESEEKYHSLYSSMNEGVALHEIIYDAAHEAVDYIITDVNQAYEEITGLKLSDVKGKKASELYGTGNPALCKDLC